MTINFRSVQCLRYASLSLSFFLSFFLLFFYFSLSLYLSPPIPLFLSSSHSLYSVLLVWSVCLYICCTYAIFLFLILSLLTLLRYKRKHVFSISSYKVNNCFVYSCFPFSSSFLSSFFSTQILPELFSMAAV